MVVSQTCINEKVKGTVQKRTCREDIPGTRSAPLHLVIAFETDVKPGEFMIFLLEPRR